MAKEAKRKCELCGDGARMYCDSDEASLCWSCDEKVHSANFLVAKHSRTLLCHACCSPTPWTASGAKLCRTVSVCPACLDQINHAQLRRDEGESNREMGSDVHQDFIDSGSDYDSGYSSDEYEEEEGDENQVVPWSASSSPSSSPPPGPSSSGGDEGSFSSRDGGGEAFSSTLRRRLRDDLDDQVVTSSSLLD
ncbi:B-box zinc finger protein 23-like [Ipomoea triloba]|uniref:B-box zinc finger protein 23-like n=1 Tax=Ipomoea triloba TaxID=35885 RepID=UPI00125E554B|nr:B-box zinc finger protein 23-like [Ipomoea triloba]